MTQDPKKGIDTDPLSHNQYIYVINNPVNEFDPNGKLAIGLVLKLLRYVGYIIRIGGRPLAALLRRSGVSKRKIRLIYRYLRQIGNALIRPFGATKSGIAKMLMRRGVRSSDAKQAAEVILWLI